MGARFYDPHLARFVQPDTVIPDFANPQSLNAYSYVYNQPLKLVDPTGRAGTPAKLIRGAGKDYGALPYKSVVKVPDPDPVKTMRARAAARLVVSVAYEPADWAMTFYDWSQGDFSLWDLAGLLPLTPASADNFVDAFRAAENLEDAADVTKVGRLFRSRTRRNFRENLRRLTGKAKEGIKGLEAHHVLPQKFAKEFERVGINVHDPRLGTWVDKAAHRGWSHEYNKQWELFFEKIDAPTEQQILQFAQQLAERYGFDVNFTVP